MARAPSTPVKEYTLLRGKHYVQDKGVTQVVLPGQKVKLSEEQFLNFRDKFADSSEGIVLANVPHGGRPVTSGAKDEGVVRVVEPPLPKGVVPLPPEESKEAKDDDDDDDL